jgi:hypothetical protein
MDAELLLVIVRIGVFAAACLVGALPRSTFRRLAQGGLAAALVLLVVFAVIIFRRPDNYFDSTDTALTIIVGWELFVLLGVWLLGAAAGRAMHRSMVTRRGRSSTGVVAGN